MCSEVYVCTQEERYVENFVDAVNAATNTYTAGTAAQNALSVVGKFNSVQAMCKMLQQHFQQLEECASLRSHMCIKFLALRFLLIMETCKALVLVS